MSDNYYFYEAIKTRIESKEMQQHNAGENEQPEQALQTLNLVPCQCPDECICIGRAYR